MSSSNVLILPSFDPGENDVILESEPLAPELVEIEPPLGGLDDLSSDLGGLNDLEPPTSFETDESEDHWEPAPGELPDLPENAAHAPDERLAAIEQLLVELESSTSLIQLEIAARVEEIVQSMTSTLFPKLAEDFLAEEISRFLAYAVPRETIRVDITVPTPLFGDLNQSLSRNTALQDFCVVREAEAGSPPVVRAHWGDGGFDYDLTSLLAACHAKTFKSPPEIEDEEEWQI